MAKYACYLMHLVIGSMSFAGINQEQMLRFRESEYVRAVPFDEASTLACVDKAQVTATARRLGVDA